MKIEREVCGGGGGEGELCEVEAKNVNVSYRHDDYLVSEEKCIEKDKIESKTRRPTILLMEVPLQSVFHSTYQPTYITPPLLYSYPKQSPQSHLHHHTTITISSSLHLPLSLSLSLPLSIYLSLINFKPLAWIPHS